MKVINIIWDLEDGDSDYSLPKKIDISSELSDEDYDAIVDWISEEYGWCIVSCDFVD